MRRTYIAAHDGTERGADAVALARVFARPHCGPVRHGARVPRTRAVGRAHRANAGPDPRRARPA